MPALRWSSLLRVSPSRRRGGLLAVAFILLVAAGSGCGGEERLVPRPRLGAEALRVTLDRRETREAPGGGGWREVEGLVSSRPVLEFAASGTADLGKFDEATVSLRVLGGEESGEAGESFWYVETGRRGAALRPGVPLRLARPEGTVRIESDRHGPFREFLFYPGKTYELVVTVAGAKGLASQRVRFMVAP